MSREPRHDVLFEPLRIGPKALKNRFYQVPHCCGFGSERPLAQARFRGMKAEGGWAAVCIEYCAISPDVHGALAGAELHHSGVHSPRRQYRLPAVAPSQLASDYLLVVPKAMEKGDIRRVQSDWVAAAQRARSAGFDLVYVYGAHSYLPMQFLSPYYNKRTDEYDGPLENRARFWLETLEVVKEAVGDDCAIVSRIAVEALGPYGVELAEGLAFVRLADDLVELWDVNIGSALEWSKDSGASSLFHEGWQLEWTGSVREATAKPIVGVGRLTSPDRVAEIVASGVWDVIGTARPSIADPFLPRKVEEGRYDEIRECIGCNVCIPKSDPGGNIGCTQNATAGEEFRRGWHPERFERAGNADRDVLVVGAGPAGSECAIVLGKRGFRRVHLVEAEAGIGGIMRWVPRLPGRGEWARVLNWRSQPHVLTPEQVMVEGKRVPGERVLVYDGEGYFMALGLAEKLAADGYRVELVTCVEEIAPFCYETLEQKLLRRRMHAAGIGMHEHVLLESIAPGRVEACDEFGEPLVFEADAVVRVTQRLSNEVLYLELAADPEALHAEGVEAGYRIGDCVAPQLIADAIFDGHRLAREIDSENPAVPLPYRRERPRPSPTPTPR